MKWKTTITYVDLETGEILSKGEAQKNYDIINKKKFTEFKTIHNETIGNISITTECRRSNQIKLYSSE